MPQYLSTDPNAGQSFRSDGSKKGSGFLGPLKRPDGSVSSEISIGVEIDGREVEIPTLVPTLSEAERRWLLVNDVGDPKKIPRSIVDKAVEFARPRLAAGQSPFADGDLPAASGGYLSMDPTAGDPMPDFQSSNEKDAGGDAVVRLTEQLEGGARGLWDEINPIAAVRGIGEAVMHPIQAVQNAGAAQGALLDKAREAYAAGDSATALRHFANYLIPLFGPRLDLASDAMARGDYGEGVGRSVGIAANMAGPTATVNAGRSIRVPALVKNPNAAEAAAVRFGQSRGIPVDAGTATGNPVVRGAQWAAERTAGGSFIGGRARQAQAAGLTRTGRQIADDVHPTPMSPELAGQGVRDAVTGQVRRANTVANTAYDKLRAIEADPKNVKSVQVGVADGQPAMKDMALPVDLRGVKSSLGPIYERLTRLYPIAKRQASAGYQAIENIVNGPDYAPLSIADDNLGAIKAITREADMPELRSVSQGLAAEAVKQLDSAVQQTARSVGVEGISALKGGRKATVIKHRAGGVLDDVRTEPVKAYRQAIESGDAAIAQLRETAAFAPGELQKIGRAYLDDMLTKATSEGGFQHGQRLAADWQRLGPQTKRLLFGKPEIVRDLDNFFLLAKKASENPNPSGTAFQLGVGAQGAALVANPVLGFGVQIGGAGLAKLLNNPQAVKLLVQGMQIPITNRARAAAVVGQLARLSGQAGTRTPEGPAIRPMPSHSPTR